MLFLCGNPTSSYLRRNITLNVGPGVRTLICMCVSGNPSIDYSFADHAAYLETWIDALHLDQVVLVGHDWGCGAGLRRPPGDLANRASGQQATLGGVTAGQRGG